MSGYTCTCEVCGGKFQWWHARKTRCENHPQPKAKPRVRVVIENGRPKYVPA